MSVQLAMAGWSFFIAENVILSENRTLIINYLNDDQEESKYHLLYGSFSTIATGTILYSYYKCRNASPYQFPLSSSPSRVRILLSLLFRSLGFVGALQLVPTLQMPVLLTHDTTNNNQDTNQPESKTSFKIRCPFDFTTQSDNATKLKGVERVTRHPALWSLAFIGLGQATVTASIPLAVWYSMPTAVALLGGSHHDSRFRRGIGGNLTVSMDAKTSNIPFYGMIFGDQQKEGGTIGAFKALSRETKSSNLMVGIGLATLMALRRIR